MTSNFELQLDTQVGLAIKLNGGATVTPSELIELAILTDPDVTEVKVWGDIEPTSPVNSLFGQAQEEAPWIPVAELLEVELHHGLGLRRLGVLARDDVLNVAEATAEIVLGEEVAPPPPRPVVSPPSQRPQELKPERRTMRSRSRAQVCDRNTVITTIPQRGRIRPGERWSAAAAIAVSTAIRPADRWAIRSGRMAHTSIGVHSGQTIKRTPLGPETAAILDLLDLL